MCNVLNVRIQIYFHGFFIWKFTTNEVSTTNDYFKNVESRKWRGGVETGFRG